MDAKATTQIGSKEAEKTLVQLEETQQDLQQKQLNRIKKDLKVSVFHRMRDWGNFRKGIKIKQRRNLNLQITSATKRRMVKNRFMMSMLMSNQLIFDQILLLSNDRT